MALSALSLGFVWLGVFALPAAASYCKDCMYFDENAYCVITDSVGFEVCYIRGLCPPSGCHETCVLSNVCVGSV